MTESKHTPTPKSRRNFITITVSDELFARLEAARKVGPYELTRTSICERGIILALDEIAATPGSPS